MNNIPIISCLICTYNREGYLSYLFESIRKQTIQKQLFEVIIIDNNSTDGTEAVCQNFISQNPTLNISYYKELNQGLSFARNRAIIECNGQILTFLDDDAFIDENYLLHLLSYNTKPTVLAVGGIILLKYESKAPAWENKYTNSLLGYFNIGKTIKPFPKNSYPRGSNMSFKKDVFQKFGVFNTKIGRIGNLKLGGEEKDLFQRIPKTQVIYDPNLIVYHFVPETRLSLSFIREQSIGIGKSEKIRLEGQLKKKIQWILIEFCKWGATFIISFYFLILCKPQKSIILLKMRYWISRGFLYE